MYNVVAVLRQGALVARQNIPFGAAEAKAVGQLPTQSFPESGLFLLGQLDQLVVVSLEILAFLDDVGAEPIVAVVALIAAAAAAASTAASATTPATTSSTTSLS